ncbi:MAG TPA: hypothetical protein VGD29_26465 [Actinoplanes sp.]|jgi:hypothetical protein
MELTHVAVERPQEPAAEVEATFAPGAVLETGPPRRTTARFKVA